MRHGRWPVDKRFEKGIFFLLRTSGALLSMGASLYRKGIMSDKYILDGHKVVECSDLMKWATWFETADRHVDKTMVGDIKISTVFLGLDHNFSDGEPQLFETMIFGGDFDQEMWRWPTWEEAEKGHARTVEMVKQLTPEQVKETTP